jgi:hypothetical protein
MNKVSARWIPKLLNPEQTLCRQHICEKNLTALADDEEFFFENCNKNSCSRSTRELHRQKRQERRIHQES